jgi:heavy metal sensor kinase
MILRSIRFSLLVYFLGLLTAALGVASLLVYQTAQRTLKDKEEAKRKLIQAKYEERCREENARLDSALLTQAQGLARRVQIEVDFSRPRPDLDFQALGLLTAPLAPGGYMTVPLWVLQWPPEPRPPAFWELRRRVVAKITLLENEQVLPDEPPPPEYFQIDQIERLSRARPLRSASMSGLSFSGPHEFAPNHLLRWEADDFAIAPGHVVRRVRLKTANIRRVTSFPPWVRRGEGKRKGGRPHPRPPVRTAGGRWFDRADGLVIQCAEETQARDAALARLRQELDEEVMGLRAQTAESLVEQRNRLLLISAATFAATVLGAFGLVWLGLAPLGRLSDAVSRVSPKDFRLPIDQQRLPRELHPIVQRLTATLELLKRAFAREKQATADISHELRTPLAALRTTTELALRKPRSAEHYRELLQDCHLSAQQMSQIVERLLTLARLDAGVDVLRPQVVDVGALAEQCAAVVRPLAEARGLQLDVRHQTSASASSASSRVNTDPDKLREVLTNLLHNAIQYNKPQGAIELTLGRQNGHLEVAVRDTGIGISPEAREHIFERFYRADPSRNTDDLHAGLGLAIVKEYVDLMGGQITVESEQGQGSTFRVELPVRELQATH